MRPERNDPCPCGSGKKYKKCCGAAVSVEPRPTFGADPFQQAQRAFASGDFQGAQGFCRVLLQQYPEHADTNHLCGVVSYRLGNFAEAKLRLAVAMQQTPDNALLHSNLSLVLHDAGELEAAAANARRAIALNPSETGRHSKCFAIRFRGKTTKSPMTSGSIRPGSIAANIRRSVLCDVPRLRRVRRRAAVAGLAND